MSISQLTNLKKTDKCCIRHRLIAAAVLIVIIALFTILAMAGAGRFELSKVFGVCGFKQHYGLPCPGCGITSSAIAFAKGDIVNAFYIQPTGAIICVVLVCIAVISLLVSVFGVNFSFLHRPLFGKLVKYMLLCFAIVILAGWTVTLARAIAEIRRAG